jgi:hypothetical protein
MLSFLLAQEEEHLEKHLTLEAQAQAHLEQHHSTVEES